MLDVTVTTRKGPAVAMQDDEPQGRRAGRWGTMQIIGATTVGAIAVGVIAWLVLELAAGMERADAITYAVWAAAAVLILGALVGYLRAMRSGPGT